MRFLTAEPAGIVRLTYGEWLTLHCPPTVLGSPAFVRAVPREAMLSMVRDYHRGHWGRVTAWDKARHADRAGYLMACYGYGRARIHVVTDHMWTWFILARE